MRKARSSKLALLLVLTMLATLFVGIPAASAAATYSTGTIVKAAAGTSQPLGSVKISVPAADLEGTPWVSLRLPTDFDLNVPVGEGYELALDTGDYYVLDDGVDTWNAVQIRVPVINNAIGDPEAGMTVDIISATEMKVRLDVANLGLAGDQDTAYFYVVFSNVFVASGFSGDVTVAIDGSSGSPFVEGSVVVATVGEGITKITIDSVKTVTTTDDAAKNIIDNLRFKEDRPGAFAEDETIKLKLPAGFEWDKNAAYDVVALDGDMYGDDPDDWVSVDVDGNDARVLVITSEATSEDAANYFMVKGLRIIVADETVAKLGEVTATVSGSASATPDSLVVAKYGEFGAKAYAVGDPTTVLAGRTGAHATVTDYTSIGKFAIEELIADSLVSGRTVTFTLVGGAKWAADADGNVIDAAIDVANSKNYGDLSGAWKVIGTTGDVARLTVGSASTKAMKVVFKNAKISIPADATGDITLVVGGSAGVTGEFVVAKVQSPVTATIDGSAPDVIIGAQGQVIPDITVVESVKEAIQAASGNNKLQVEFPLGIVPAKPAKVEVTEGDLVIDPVSLNVGYNTANGKWYFEVTVKSTSSTPSKIKFSGLKVTIDRTVPEGALKAGIKGNSLVMNTGDFPGRSTAYSLTVANTVTPAPGQTTGTAVFTIGQAKYVLNGKEVAMDVAPYIKDGRTMLPVRFAANAVGVSDANIMWDSVLKKVTLIKGDRVVQYTIGSKVMMINGAALTMDAAPEIVSGRTMVPLRFVAQALGADIQYDPATQAVTVKF